MSSKDDEGGPEAVSNTSDPSIVDVGRIARWSVSSHKYGHALSSLRDGNPNTFWQSEGPQPHYIDLAFVKKVYVSSVQIRCSHANDDSYTPKKISISAGTGLHDVIEVRSMDLDRPEGWIHIPLRTATVEEPDEGKEPRAEGELPKMREVDGPPIPCNYLRVQIMENHLNGKDTHVRGLKVFGLPGSVSAGARERATVTRPTAVKIAQPEVAHSNQPAVKVAESSAPAADATEQPADDIDWLELGHDGLADFTSLDFKMHETLR